MKHLTVLIILFYLILPTLNSANKNTKKGDKKMEIKLADNQITGDWLGNLKVNEQVSLRITFSISQKDNKLIGTMGSPDQIAMGITIDSINYKDGVLEIILNKLSINFKGKIKDDKLIGEFIQNGAKYPLELSKIKSLNSLKKVYKQTPKKPYPYIEEEVTFLNKKANIELAGTLTYPQSDKFKAFPAIILIAGSGPNDRNETGMGHFLYIADKLTKQGYAVLRFDKRGIKKSKGDHVKATTYDFAEDVYYAVDYLLTRNIINKDKIGLLGHSEGAMIAPLVATQRKDISFLILMGTPGLSGEKVLLKQIEDISKVSGLKDEEIKAADKLNKKIYKLLKSDKSDDVIKKELLELSPKLKNSLKSVMSKWFREFLIFEPSKYLEKIKIPTLILSGEKDLQVSAVENNKAIEKSLKKANNKNYKIIVFKNLNHLFQTAKTGSPDEYAKLDEIMNEEVMESVEKWLKTLK